MKPAVLLLAAAALTLSACETSRTFYSPAPADSRTSGFFDSRIAHDRFRVSYRGGDGAPPAQVEDYALLHAADVTLGNGDEWFLVESRYGAAGPGSSSSLSIGFGGASFGRGGGFGYGVGQTVPLGGGPQLTSTLEIITGKGAPPPGAYAARDVQASIRPRLPPLPQPGR